MPSKIPDTFTAEHWNNILCNDRTTQHIVEQDQNPSNPNEKGRHGTSRRQFLSQVTVAGAGLTISPFVIAGQPPAVSESAPTAAEVLSVQLRVNNIAHQLTLDSRVTLLDALRETLLLTGTKKGCDHGQCGACTVLMDGKRINSCLVFAGMCGGADITTVEGVSQGDQLHPVQQAFIKHDAFQCGYCTPGQICSAIGLISEGKAKTTSAIREAMSGNICRCGAYQNIVAAIQEVQNS